MEPCKPKTGGASAIYFETHRQTCVGTIPLLTYHVRVINPVLTLRGTASD